VINLLTAHPRKRFTLTEIIRQLDITKATCHVLLRSLAGAGYVVRHPDKTYTLGPALVAAGRVAQEAFSALGSAGPEMKRLSEDFDAVVTAAALVGNELVILERLGISEAPDHLTVGHRIPFIPPMGMSFVAWGDDDLLDEWLARSTRLLGQEERDRWRQVRAAMHQVGYGVERMSQTWAKVRRLVGELADEQLTPAGRDLLNRLIAEIGPAHFLPDEVKGTDPLPISVIYAPVLDERGNVEMSIALNLFRALSPREVQRAGTEIAATGRRLSALLGLSLPRSDHA
jgi:DNA-binding IclR family transcriptional regulator